MELQTLKLSKREVLISSLGERHEMTIMYYTRPRYFTLGTSWIYRPRFTSPIFVVALWIILAQT